MRSFLFLSLITLGAVTAQTTCQTKYGSQATCAAATTCAAGTGTSGWAADGCSTGQVCCLNFKLTSAFDIYDPKATPWQTTALTNWYENQLKYFPDVMTKFTCMFRNLQSACGDDVTLTNVGTYYTGLSHQTAAIEYLQTTVEGWLSTQADGLFKQWITYTGFIREFRHTLVTATAAPVPSTGSSCTDLSKPAVKFIQSPNYGSRSGTTIDTIIMHNTEGSLQAAINRFLTPSEQVSAHFIIDRDGSITQMVDESGRAWHAGNSPINYRSIGIEHVAGPPPVGRGMTPVQTKVSIALVRYLINKYKISLARILPHRQVTSTDCPGSIWATDAIFNSWKSANLPCLSTLGADLGQFDAPIDSIDAEAMGPDGESNTKKTSLVVIAVSIVAGVLLLVVIATAVVCLRRRKTNAVVNTAHITQEMV